MTTYFKKNRQKMVLIWSHNKTYIYYYKGNIWIKINRTNGYKETVHHWFNNTGKDDFKSENAKIKRLHLIDNIKGF